MKQKTPPTEQNFHDLRATHNVGFHLPLWNQGSILLLLSDALGLILAWRIAGYLNQFHSPIPEDLVWWVWLGIPSLFWIFASLTLILFAKNQLYQISLQGQNYVKSAQLISVVYITSLVLGYFYDPKLDAPRSLFMTAWVGSIVLVVLFRLLISLIWNQLLNKSQPINVFLIASSVKIKKLAQILENRANYRVVGMALASTAQSPIVLQKIAQSGAQEVLATDLPKTELASTLYWHIRRCGLSLRLIPSSIEMLHRRGSLEIFAGLPTLRLDTHLFIGWDYQLKRLIDFVSSLAGIIVLSPLFVGVAIAIKVSSPGPVFFCQERIGLQGKVFQMWKFRTMVQNAAELQAKLESQNQSKDGVMFKIKKDPRITSVGAFLRKSSIDELPQLFNVLIGQMSLVGPRPLPLRDVERFDTWHHIRHQVLPGITGLWQISGRSDIEEFDDAARLDLFYIDNWSLNLDLDILMATVKIILFGKGAY